MIQLIINSVLLGAALAMDAFSVSIANGIIEPNMRKRRMLMIAGVYAIFQMMMPMIGWFLITTVEGIFNSFKTFIPWIALILLLFIGGKMVIEGIKDRKQGEKKEEKDQPAAKLTFGVKAI